jgi:hypothetical protein
VELETERQAILERNATEKAKQQAELELALHKMQVERQRIDGEIAALQQAKAYDQAAAERTRAQTDAELSLEEAKSKASSLVMDRDLAHVRTKREIENTLSDQNVKAQLIQALPEIAAKLPAPKELRTVSISGDGGPASQLTGLLESVMALIDSRRHAEPGAGKIEPPKAK